MTDWRLLSAHGAIVASAVYLGGVIAAGLATGNAVAWRVGLFSAGLTYLGYFVQVVMPPGELPAKGLSLLSIAAGVVAGFALLV